MRPRLDIDQHQMESLCRLKPRIEDVANFFKCSPDTIENRVKEWGYTCFSAFRDENMVHTRFNIIRKAIQKAEKGDNCMLIFCLKNLAGWTDKQEIEQTTKIEVNITNEDSGL